MSAEINCIGVTLTGPLSRLAETETISLAWSDLADGQPACLETVFASLIENYPEAAGWLRGKTDPETGQALFPAGIVVVKNGVALPRRLETEIGAGDQLTILPMISGG